MNPLKGLSLEEVMCLNTLLSKAIRENPELEHSSAKAMYQAGVHAHADMATQLRIQKEVAERNRK